MAKYKVSYSMLSEQGEELKQLAKMVDGYAEKVNAVKSRLGSDGLLEQVRSNLGKFTAQLNESRAVLDTAGGLLVKTVEGYTAGETRQVKKVDGLKAHNRDFYKNPVVVASAGAAGAAAGAGTTVNVTDNSTTVNYYSAEPAAAAPASAAQAVPISAGSTAQAAGKAASGASAPGSAGIAAGAGLAGGAAGAGIVEGALHLKKKKKEQTGTEFGAAPGQDNLEARLAQAREKARRLNEQRDS